MPSPVGHSLAGLCGYVLIRQRVAPRWGLVLVFGSVFVANLPDLDILPGLLLRDPRIFHHQMTHSLVAVFAIGLLVGCLARRWKLNGIGCGGWAIGVYGSHVLMDLLVNDPQPPFGVQVFWPFSQDYFISPFKPFASFEYFDPQQGVISAVFSIHNLATVCWEILLLAPFIGLALLFEKYRHDSQLFSALGQSTSRK